MVKVHGCLIVYENNNPMNFPITYNLYPITHLLDSQTYYPLGMLIEVSKEIPLNRSALHWLPERNGCKPSQKVFELTILGVCNRYLKILLSGKKRKYLYFDFYASLRKWLALQAKWNYLRVLLF